MTCALMHTATHTAISEKSHACITGGSTKQHYSVVSHKGCGVTKSGAGSNQQTDLKLELKPSQAVSAL